MVFRAPTQSESGEWLRESESAGILKPGAWDGVIHGCDEECVGKQKNSTSYHCDSRKKCKAVVVEETCVVAWALIL